ncbi:hypothetical protein, partial [Escherichia coli]|uniref:hypothetical protein n=1 Tax=Escherichia coli TaxID=562 RepID=UPI001FF3C533
ADRNRSHWSTSKTPSYTKSVSWQHHQQIDKIKLKSSLIKENKGIDRRMGGISWRKKSNANFMHIMALLDIQQS